jgi:predicted transglutaminase-like cysteine proteinase
MMIGILVRSWLAMLLVVLLAAVAVEASTPHRATTLLVTASIGTPAQGVPAETTVPETVPIAAKARAKFRRTDPAQVDALAYINSYVNAAIIYEPDQDNYGVKDFWVMGPQNQKGDCEDYALTKLLVLSQANFNVVSGTKLVGVVVHHKKEAIGGHMILAVRFKSGEVAYLDSNFSDLMTRRELVARGYEFFDWKA